MGMKASRVLKDQRDERYGRNSVRGAEAAHLCTSATRFPFPGSGVFVHYRRRRQGSAADFRFSCIRLRVRVELQGFQEMLETEDTQ